MPLPSNSFYRPIIGCTVAIFSAFTPSICQPKKQQQTITLQGETMGTTCTVKYFPDDQDRPPPPAEIQKRIDGALKEADRQVSAYQTDSGINQFNQLRTVNQVMPTSQDFAYATGEALRLNKLMHSALDVTVGPLVNFWGFGPQKEVTYEPIIQEVQHASEMVGTDKPKLSQGGQYPTLAKAYPEVYLDLSSIAKSLGVDKTATKLGKSNIDSYLAEVDGELYGRGRNAQNSPWRIGIEQSSTVQDGATQITIPLDNKSLATPGGYRIFHVDKSGRRLSHVINPKTKQPISHSLASIGVAVRSATFADGLSTGSFVPGETETFKPAEQGNLAVLLIIRTLQDGYRAKIPSTFKKLLN